MLLVFPTPGLLEGKRLMELLMELLKILPRRPLTGGPPPFGGS